MTKKEKIAQDLARLTKKERKIYQSVRDNFKATKHEAAFDVAIQGGVSWQFIPK
jgi:DNA-binding MurR/RpiR family transcriptional regulator